MKQKKLFIIIGIVLILVCSIFGYVVLSKKLYRFDFNKDININEKYNKNNNKKTTTSTTTSTSTTTEVIEETTTLATREINKQTTKKTTNRTTTQKSSILSTENKEEILEDSSKYGVKIQKIKTYTLTTYSDGSTKISNEKTTNKKDTSSFNATTAEMLPEATNLASSQSSKINEMLNYVNEYRSEVGANPLTIDNNLTKAAMVRAIELAWSEKFDHQRPNGTMCYTVCNDIGCKAYAENIAAGYASSSSTANQWRYSEGHYKNMINPNYTKIGVGVITLSGTKYGTYWVQLFS